MRAWMLSLVIFIVVVSAFVFFYKKWNEPQHITPINRNLQLLGVIDMDGNHGIDLQKVTKGDDVLLVLDKNGYLNQFMPNHPEYSQYYSKPFDLVYFDPDGEGVIDSEDPLWNYLYIVIYDDDGQTYQVRTLHQAGIYAILTKHLTARGNHSVMLSDGGTRILYEVTGLRIAS